MSHKSLFSLTFISFLFSQFLAETIVDYDGVSTVTFNTKDEWGVKYGLGANCDDDSIIELEIEILGTSSQADLILGFGTESNYFAAFTPYDNGMCLPCGTGGRNGALFVTPPTGSSLRSPDLGKTTTTQYGATTNWLGARVALVNSQDQTAEWELILPHGNAINQNKSPIKLTIVQDTSAGETTLTVNKNGITSPDMTFTSTFGAGDDLFLFLGIDDANAESFELSGITVLQNQCDSCPYKYVDGVTRTYDEAKTFCDADYDGLATIITQEEFDCARNLVTGDPAWIGLQSLDDVTYNGGKFTYIDDTVCPVPFNGQYGQCVPSLWWEYKGGDGRPRCMHNDENGKKCVNIDSAYIDNDIDCDTEKIAVLCNDGGNPL